MLLFFLPYALSFAVLGLLVFPVVRYLWDPNGLRKFPSPSVAAFSSFWRVWHNLHYNHYAAVDNAHKRLGTHVRIAPNHISIFDPRAPNEVYGHGANMFKEAWYDAGAGAHRNLADTRVKVEHQAKRKMLAHAFAAKTVVGLEPILVETLSIFMKQMDKHATAGTRFNMRLMLNYFTIDLFGNLLYGHKLGCLERENDLLDAESPRDGRIYKVPFIQSLLDATVVNTVLAFAPKLLPITKPLLNYHPYKKKGTDWENIVYHNTKERMANHAPGDGLLKKLLQDSKGQELNLSLGEINAECSAMMNAGTETTTAAMTNTVYLLYTHPHILAKLRAEIDTAIPGANIPSYDAASKLPYLRACIEYSLRVRPASSFGLPRVVLEGGRHIAGQFVPEGVTVSVPTYSLLRDESVFEHATEYDPDRWMTDDSEKKHRMMTNHLPFSTGPCACIGRNIAYFEQIVVIAALAKFYDCIVPNGFKLETQERFNSNPGPLVVEVMPRRKE
ncbi:Cytochrome P450 [Fusarium sp. LHS14.1]|nr:Cytochrome P450 [Fusarium sp. LHS14.1]